MIRTPSISSSQLFIMLVTSRMFSMFTYKPQKLSLGFTTATLAILVSVIINILIFVPTLSLLKKYQGRNVADCVALQHKGGARIYAVLMLVVCLFLSIECVTQFEIFMASTIYITASPFFFVLPIVLVCVFLCRLGIESMARMSSYVFSGLILCFIGIAASAFSKTNTVWIEPLGYDTTKEFLQFVADNVFHTTEIIPFMFLASYAKGNLKKGTVWFAIGTGAMFELISFFIITALGNYRESVLFPFYTVSAMAESTLSERFNAAFISLWVFMGAVKLCVYLFVAGKCIRELRTFKNDNVPLVIVGAVVAIAALITTQQIYYVNTMYSIIVSGVPIIVLAIAYPLILIIGQKMGERRRSR